jgi:hypothetical protein
MSARTAIDDRDGTRPVADEALRERSTDSARPTGHDNDGVLDCHA